MDQPQRSQLELYAQVIAAYQRAGFWPLFKHAYIQSGKEWLANGWLWIVVISLAVLIGIIPAALLVFYADRPDALKWWQWQMFFLLVCTALFFWILVDLEKRIKTAFEDDLKKYSSLIKTYGTGRTFTRYILFRNELLKYKVDKKDAKNVKLLFRIDRQTLGSYVAQNPISTWMATTLTLILANSAKNWPYLFVLMFAAIILSILFMIWTLPTFTIFFANQRMQYELQRWLGWYEAEASKPPILTPDGANPSPD